MCVFRLCEDSIEFLGTLMKRCALEIASGDVLFNCLSTVRYDNFPSRASIIKALAIISDSVVASDEIKMPLQEKIFHLVSFLYFKILSFFCLFQ